MGSVEECAHAQGYLSGFRDMGSNKNSRKASAVPCRFISTFDSKSMKKVAEVAVEEPDQPILI